MNRRSMDALDIEIATERAKILSPFLGSAPVLPPSKVPPPKNTKPSWRVRKVSDGLYEVWRTGEVVTAKDRFATSAEAERVAYERSVKEGTR